MDRTACNSRLSRKLKCMVHTRRSTTREDIMERITNAVYFSRRNPAFTSFRGRVELCIGNEEETVEHLESVGEFDEGLFKVVLVFNYPIT
ncbi:hypothetical protein J6590_033975 [Homalodisca vitripennis]|nr:hypothetical protein J6590_033975 [Homalodisca vitripennis]